MSRGCRRSTRSVPMRSSRPSTRSSDGLTSWITPWWSITATASEQARTTVSQRAGASVPIIVLFLLEGADDREPAAELLGHEVDQPAAGGAVGADELQRRLAAVVQLGHARLRADLLLVLGQ